MAMKLMPSAGSPSPDASAPQLPRWVDSSVIWRRIEQFLGASRWLPYQLGAVASLSFAMALMAPWFWSEKFLVLWFVLYPFWSGLDVFWKTPLRKTISTAMAIGTLMTVSILFLVHRG
jgi:hypothetical protein